MLQWVRWTAWIAAILAGMAAAGPASAQGAVKNTFGDWKLRCDQPSGAMAEQCRVEQYVVDAAHPNITLVAMVFTTADRKARLLRVIAPLGVMLPKQMELGLDGKRIGFMTFARCNVVGCTADVVDDEKINVIGHLKSGKSLTVTIWPDNEEGIPLPNSLEGVAEAVVSLH